MAVTEKHCLDLVDRQLAAYNRRDIDGFCACFSENITLFKVGEELVTGRLGTDVRAVAIYLVGETQIEKVWFIA